MKERTTNMKLTNQELKHIVNQIDKGYTIQFNYTTFNQYKKYCYQINKYLESIGRKPEPLPFITN
jgi:ribulose bisphosphate carboxylase small subunit|tara:strand:- start:299 stop:493 length:195 start_codon:yes stop_codon:yes gene_type:complete